MHWRRKFLLKRKCSLRLTIQCNKGNITKKFPCQDISAEIYLNFLRKEILSRQLLVFYLKGQSHEKVGDKKPCDVILSSN
jgi:hypothetical protein